MDSAEYAPKGLDKEIQLSSKENNTAGSRGKSFFFLSHYVEI